MPDDYTNSIAAGRYRFRDALSTLDAVQTLTGADDADGALERIYLDVARDDDMPAADGYVVVSCGEQPLSLTKNASGAQYRMTRSVTIELGSVVPAAHRGSSGSQQRAAMEWWSTLVGDIVDELAAYCNAGAGRPILNGLTVTEGPGRLEPVEHQPGGDWLFALITVTFQE